MASVGSSEVNSGCPAGLSEYVFRTDESVNAKGCVLLCMNMYLQLAGREALSVHELRAAMQKVWKDCGCDTEEFQKVTGKQRLGHLEEDEACFNQVSYALQSKFGSGVEIVRAKRKTCMENFEYLLFQVVMQREETDSENDPWHNKFYENEHGLYTHAYKGHSGPEFDSEWLHCILLCTKTRQFFCHNIGKWVELKHLDLQEDPKTGAVTTGGTGYIRTIERVYGLNCVMESSRPKRGNTVRPSVERLVEQLRKNDPTLGILKLSERVGHISTFELHAVLDALSENETVKVANLQSQLATSETVDKLIDVLKQKRIWAVNIGEWDKPSEDDWQHLINAIPDTNLCFTYITESKKCALTRDQKNECIAAMGKNRKRFTEWYKTDREIAAKVEKMWWRPCLSIYMQEGAKRKAVVDARASKRRRAGTNEGRVDSYVRDNFTKLFGAAMFMDRDHFGSAKDYARSRTALEMVTHANRVIEQTCAETWQPYKLFTPDESFRSEIRDFEHIVQVHLAGSRERVNFCSLDVDMLTSHLDTTRMESGNVLVAVLDLGTLWPQFQTDIEQLYEYAKALFQPKNRPGTASPVGTPQTDRCEMRQHGVKKMHLNAQDVPFVKVISQGDDGKLYSEYLRHAALFYSKQHILEKQICPQSNEMRKTLRDEHMEGGHPACCAIPGLEAFLYAIEVTITADYYPLLHHDRKAGQTPECILFGAHPNAVFGVKHGGTEQVVRLDRPKMIVLDPGLGWHASQRNEDDARKEFQVVDNTYRILGLPCGASDDEIKTRYHDIIKQMRPWYIERYHNAYKYLIDDQGTRRPKCAIVINGLPGAGKTFVGKTVASMLEKQFEVSVEPFGSDRPVRRAVTVFKDGKSTEIAMIGDFQPPSEPRTETHIGFEATNAFRSEFSRNKHLAGLVASTKARILITEGLLLTDGAMEALEKTGRKVVVLNLTTDKTLAHERYTVRNEECRKHFPIWKNESTEQREGKFKASISKMIGYGFEIVDTSCTDAIELIKKSV